MKIQTSQKTTYKRYHMLALVFISVVINYMDRSNISIAAFAMSEELGFSSVQMGLVFSAFAWTYAALQIPGGILVDMVRPRILYTLMLSLWSAATLLQGFANSFLSVIGFRASIGVFEAPAYPANNRIVTSWFPESERASAIAMYTSGQYIGLAFLTPSLVAIQNYMGWRGLFVVSGLIGMGWAIVWYLFYRDPQSHAKISEQEMTYIAEGGGLIDKREEKKFRVKFNWADFKQAFIYRKLWGIYLGQFAIGSIFIFFLTWFPTYLVKYRGMDFLESGFLASIPFLAAFVGVLLAGFTSDFLLKKGYSNEVARKLPVLSGMLLSVSIIGANYVDSTFLVISFLALAFFGNGFSAITWVFVSTVAPKQLIGLIGGVFNFIGGLSAVIVPIVIGFLVEDGDFRPALFFIGTMALMGFFSYIFLVGKVERIELEDDL
ncbi:ACS family D-galactonate transporter-like MFS transporter [Catalinimonas alkaloidigena]|uniref:MFS transporter n=1 Tax=Catalinimonas alkaloidigena TaxID=1075417 RepID=UPI00240640F4|nr:MFS transporter [Catalinimonas alkaloidigena]MDF9796449.1 ACS family D-galactonate transporter-like MFS transporter [Catalinimonas alkaloidigena]